MLWAIQKLLQCGHQNKATEVVLGSRLCRPATTFAEPQDQMTRAISNGTSVGIVEPI